MKTALQKRAEEVLEGVGDPRHEWHEWSGYAYHIRRRLTPEEQLSVGPVVDCRNTEEFTRRYQDCCRVLPEAMKRFAVEEANSLRP